MDVLFCVPFSLMTIVRRVTFKRLNGPIFVHMSSLFVRSVSPLHNWSQTRHSKEIEMNKLYHYICGFASYHCVVLVFIPLACIS